ncbi:MAG: Spy/CpxP family protein refolding chaperone, partial [Endomicrobiaceae bacterium]|nr:Spy/CpxP family protein refolding chaperone [Endomicrobiaceae bacterium]
DNQFSECPDPSEDNGQQPPRLENKMKDKDCKMKEKFEKMLKKLNITDAQKTKMDELMNSDKEKRASLKKQIHEKRQALDNELLKADYDKAVVENLTKDIRQLSGDIVQIQIDGKIQIRNILTYEQFKKIEEDRIKMQKEMKGKMGKMGKMKSNKE